MTEVFTDMDGSTGSNPSDLLSLHPPTVFEIAGWRVEERLIKWNALLKIKKLIWCLEPISRATLQVKSAEGLEVLTRHFRNYLFHIDYKEEDELEQAREKVRAKFVEHYTKEGVFKS